MPFIETNAIKFDDDEIEIKDKSVLPPKAGSFIDPSEIKFDDEPGVLPSKVAAPKRGIAGDVVSHLARGVEHGAGLLGGTLEMLDAKTTETPEEEGFLDRTGRRMREWSERPAEEKASVFLPSADEVSGKEGYVKRKIMEGVESIPSSVIPTLGGAAIGAAAGAAGGGGIGAVPGALIGALGGAATTAGVFGLGTYKQKKVEYDTKAAHLPEELRHQLAKDYAIAEAGPELASDLISSLAFFGKPFVKPIAKGAMKALGRTASEVSGDLTKQGIKSLIKMTPKEFAGKLAVSYAGELGTEAYTGMKQSELDSTAYGTPEMSYFEALGEVAIPTAVMTLAFGLGGTGIDIHSKRKALADLNSEDMQTRVDALKDTARRIEDKEIRQAWLDFGSRAIASGKQIDLNADFAIGQGPETSVLPTDPVDMTAPKTAPKPSAESLTRPQADDNEPPPPPGAAPVVEPEESVIPKAVDLMAPKDVTEEPVSPARSVLPAEQALPQPVEAILPQTEGQVIPDGQEGTKDANANAEGQGQKGLLSVVPEQNAADQPSVEPVTGPSAVEAAPAKEPWQLSKEEWNSSLTKALEWSKTNNAEAAIQLEQLTSDIADGEGTGEDNTATHEDTVKKAIREGKPVPAEVLAEYPDLQPDPQSRILTPEEQEELGVTYNGEQDTSSVEAYYSAYTDKETGSTFIVENRGEIAPTVEKMRKSFKDAEAASAPSVVPETPTPETSVVPETLEAAAEQQTVTPETKLSPEAKLPAIQESVKTETPIGKPSRTTRSLIASGEKMILRRDFNRLQDVPVYNRAKVEKMFLDNHGIKVVNKMPKIKKQPKEQAKTETAGETEKTAAAEGVVPTEAKEEESKEKTAEDLSENTGKGEKSESKIKAEEPSPEPKPGTPLMVNTIKAYTSKGKPVYGKMDAQGAIAEKKADIETFESILKCLRGAA